MPRFNTDTLAGFGQPWLDVQWLAHVCWYAVHRVTGDAGVVVLRAILMIAALSLPSWTDRSPSLRPLIVALVATAIAAPFFAARAQSFAELFASVALYLLNGKLTTSRRVALLVLALLWANMHGSAALLPGLVALKILTDTHQRAHNAALFGLTSLSLIATPYGATALSHFRGTLLNPLLRQWVEEWATARILDRPVFFLAIVVVLAAALRASAWKNSLFGFVVTLLTATLGVWSNRHQVYFALAVVHFATPWLSEALGERLKFRVSDRPPWLKWLVLGCAVVSLGLARQSALRRRGDGFEGYAAIVRAAILRHESVFVDLSIADRLLYVEPRCAGAIAVDVRLELWSAAEFAFQRALERDRSTAGLSRWERFDLLWIERRDDYRWQLAQLAHSPRWKIVASSRIGTIFERIAGVR